MILKLQVKTSNTGKLFELVLKKSKYRVGRRFDNDLRIKESYVSAYHAEILKDSDENYTLHDKGSSNGTFVNGTKVEGGKGHPIKAGDVLKFGVLRVDVAEQKNDGPHVVALSERELGDKPEPPGGKTEPISAKSDEGAGPLPVSSRIPRPGSEIRGDYQKSAGEVAKLKKELEEAKQEKEKAVAELKKENKALAESKTDLERRIEKIRENEKAEKKQHQKNSESDAKELERITAEFSGKEGELQREISDLKKSLQREQENAKKAEADALEGKKSSEIITELQTQIRDLELEKSDLEKDGRKSLRLSESLERKLEREKGERLSLEDKLKEKAAEAAAAALLASKFEKNEHGAAEAGKKQAEELRKQIALLDKKLDEREADSKQRQDKLDEISEKLAGKQDDLTAAESKISSLEKEREESADQAKKESEKLRSEIEELQSRTKEQEKEISGLKTEQESKLSDFEKTQKELQEKGQSEEELSKKLAELKDSLEEKKKEITHLQSERDSKLSDVEKSKQELQQRDKAQEDLKNELSALQASVDKKEAALKESDREKETAKEELSKSAETLKALEGSKAKLEKEFGELSSQIESQAGEKSALEKEKAALAAELDEQKESLAELKTSLEEANSKNQELQKHLTEESSKGKTAQDLADSLKEKLQKAVAETESLELALKTAEAEKAALGKENEKNENRIIAELEVQVSNLESELLEVRDHFEEKAHAEALEERKSLIEQHDQELEEITSLRDKAIFEKENAENSLSEAREQITQLTAAERELQKDLETETKDWEKKWKDLRREKERLERDIGKFEAVEKKIEEANEAEKEYQLKIGNLKTEYNALELKKSSLQKESVRLAEKKSEIDSGLKITQNELDSIESRCKESRSLEEKLSRKIEAAEKRVGALKSLESELELAIQRGNKLHPDSGVDRSDVFAESADGDFITAALNDSLTEEAFCKKLINKLDLLEDLMVRFDKKWRYPRVSEQLSILRDSFLEMLKEHSVKRFVLEPGDTLSLEERKRIKLISSKDAKRSAQKNGDEESMGSQVIETIRPGYLYYKGANEIILRKAEVIVA